MYAEDFNCTVNELDLTEAVDPCTQLSEGTHLFQARGDHILAHKASLKLRSTS